MSESIDSLITKNLIETLSTITIENGYNTQIGKVELARSVLNIKEHPYCLVVPNESDPDIDYDTTRSDTLNFMVWYFDGLSDSNDENSDPFTWRFRNVPSDIIKCLRQDPSRNGLAQETTITSSDFSLYIDSSGAVEEGVYVYITILRMINSDNPYELAG